MELTRVDSAKLKTAVEGALSKMNDAIALLSPHLVLVSEEDRQHLLRPRNDFSPVARQLALLLKSYSDISKFADYSSDAVTEDLNNVAMLESLIAPMTRIMQMMNDSKLQWQAEVYEQTIEGYHAAKGRMHKDDTLARLMKPIVDYFSANTAKARGKKPAPEPKKPESK